MKKKTNKNKNKGGSVKDNQNLLEVDDELSEQAKIQIEKEVEKKIEHAIKDLEKEKNKSLEMELKQKHLFDKLEIDALLNLNIIDTENYKNNQEYIKNSLIGDKANTDITRMWLMHLLGGGMLASHFIDKNGSLYKKEKIENEILRITSWKGTTENDSWFYHILGKGVKSTFLKAAYFTSFFKQIYKFIESWVFYISSIRNTKSGLIKTASLGSTMLVLYSGAFDNFPALTYLEKIPGANILIDQIKSEESMNKISKIASGILAFTSLITIFSAIIAFYESFYYTIEREQIKKFLNEGISQSEKSQMFIFKDSFQKFDQMVIELQSNSDEYIVNYLNKAHIKNRKESGWFTSANSYGRRVYDILTKYLTKNNREEFYVICRKEVPIIPYAIYYFNQKGEPRTVRETICSIIIGLDSIDTKVFKELRSFNIISEKRQKDLSPYTGGNNSVKNNKNIIKKKSFKKFKTTIKN